MISAPRSESITAPPSTPTSEPGRSCPLHYRTAPAALARPADAQCETLFVVGGLYGNEGALDAVIELFEREPGPRRLVFNGDFNWFNVDDAAFEAINTRVLAFDALRGNVETELSPGHTDTDTDTDAGCGCAYPEWVGADVVERSNRIMQRLRATARRFPALTHRLAALPMQWRVDVAGLRVGVVHGDAESLAGWGFAQEHLRDAAHRQRVRGWFEAAQVDVFACSHTCLPIFQSLPLPGRALSALVANNGSAGMPNFRGDPTGLLTRISVRPFNGSERRFGVLRGGVHIDAIAVHSDTARWQRSFLRQWPPGSDAHASYWDRITRGPDFEFSDALSDAATTS